MTSHECVKVEQLTGVDYYTNSFRALEFIRPHAISFAGHDACLVPDPALIKFWREDLASAFPGKIRVGLCWRSGINSYKRRRQHFELASLLQIFEGIDCALINLQYDGDLDWHSITPSPTQPQLEFLNADLKDDLEALAAILANLDLVISAPTNVAELAGCLGIPVWMISTVNGITVSYRTGENDGDLWFPSMRHFNAHRHGGLEKLIRGMREEMRQVVDTTTKAPPVESRGSLSVRKALSSDLRPIFELSNQPSVRDSSFNSDPIAWADHVRWFAEATTDSNCGFYIAEIGGALAGQLRFNRQEEQAVVSISVDARFRGEGVGVALFQQGLADFMLTHPVQKIIAKIKKRNKPSITFFQRLGFSISSSERVDEEESVTMVYRPRGFEVES